MGTFHLLAATAAMFAVPLAAAPTGSFSPERLSAFDKAISSDAFEGRGPATEAEPKVIRYITEQFQAAGVQPGGDLVNGQRQWTQAVPLLKSEWAGAPKVGMTAGSRSVGWWCRLCHLCFLGSGKAQAKSRSP